MLPEIYAVIKYWHIHSWNIPMHIMTMFETYIRNNENSIIIHTKCYFYFYSIRQWPQENNQNFQLFFITFLKSAYIWFSHSLNLTKIGYSCQTNSIFGNTKNILLSGSTLAFGSRRPCFKSRLGRKIFVFHFWVRSHDCS